MKNAAFGVLLLAVFSSTSHAKELTPHAFAKVGEATFGPTPMHVKYGQVGAFDAYLDLGSIFRSSGVTVATVEARRVGGEGRTVRTETTILIVCSLGTYSLDHVDYYEVSGVKFHSWQNPAYDRTIPAPASMMAAVLDLACHGS